MEDAGAEIGADRIVDGVPQDRGRAQQEEERPEAERPQAREAARGEEEGVAGKERGHHEPRLQEDDQEEQGVGVAPVLLDDLGQVLVEVQEEVDEPVDELHVPLSLGG